MTFRRLAPAIATLLALITGSAAAQAEPKSREAGTAAAAMTADDENDDDHKAHCKNGADGKTEKCAEPAVVRPSPPTPIPASPPQRPPAAFKMIEAGPGSSGLTVLSYFQRGVMKLDTTNAFGMVIIPRRAVTDAERLRHRQFCELLLSSIDFVEPGEVLPVEMLATYWPTVARIDPASLQIAFASHDCQNLLLWYDHTLARRIAARTGLEDKSGPLLLTWPSQKTVSREQRDPLVVDFARANTQNARRTLAYWFRQVSQDPSLWTDKIREGTLRADLADAINETAGVMLSVLSGKWEGLAEVTTAEP